MHPSLVGPRKIFKINSDQKKSIRCSEKNIGQIDYYGDISKDRKANKFERLRFDNTKYCVLDRAKGDEF